MGCVRRYSDYTHIFRILSAQLLQHGQVELEEEAEAECAPELHHAARGISTQLQLLRQARANRLQ